jgi:hypothetical protein
VSLSVIDAACTRLVHWVARGALRLQAPLSAKVTVDRIARRLPPLGRSDAQTAMEEIARSGSCLSRALAVGARLPGAEVVIGLDTQLSARPAGHAWIELDGSRIDAGTTSMFLGEEIGRLPRTAARNDRRGSYRAPSR